MSRPVDPSNGDIDRDRADDELLARLGDAMNAIDPPPADLEAVAMRAFTWDVDLAHLASLVQPEAVLVRDSADRLIDSDVDSDADRTSQVFELDNYVIEVEVEPGSDGPVTLRGMINPRVLEAFLTSPGTPSVVRRVECDEFGRFEARVAGPTVAVEFIGADDLARRTPLLDL